MSGSSLGQTFWNAADPADIFGNSGSSILGNAADPGNLFGMNNGSGFHNSSSGSGGSAVPYQQETFPSYGGNLPGSFSNKGYSSPSMTGYGYGYYGGMAPIPEGGYYNQMAQAMAGPNYAPVGSSWETLAPGQSWNSPASGYTGSAGSKGGKGGMGAQTGTQMTSGGGTSPTGSGGSYGNGSKGGLMSPFPIGQPTGYGSNPTIPGSMNPYTGQMYTSAPQSGQSLSNLGTGFYGQSTMPTATTGYSGGNRAPTNTGSGYSSGGSTVPAFAQGGQSWNGIGPLAAWKQRVGMPTMGGGGAF